MTKTICARANRFTADILEIMAVAKAEPDLAPGELHCRIWRRVCAELADFAQLVASEREAHDE